MLSETDKHKLKFNQLKVDSGKWTVKEFSSKIGFKIHRRSRYHNMDYIKKIKENPIARAVKLADLTHNSDLSRLDMVDDRAVRRVEKYAAAIKLLSSE